MLVAVVVFAATIMIDELFSLRSGMLLSDVYRARENNKRNHKQCLAQFEVSAYAREVCAVYHNV